jgi:adenosylmethionine-8-amino-7-oxononanoate aminotransferase
MGSDNIAAFIGEPVLGGGGNIAPPDEYWPIIRGICNNYGILLILDEVITGWGKTGKLFACNHWDIVPDIMVTAKGLTGAYLPLSAVITREHVYQAFKGHGSPYVGHTHSSYPAGVACALATIDVIMKQKLWENAARVGKHIRKRLEEICQRFEIAGTVHGIGLMLGLEIVEDKASKVASPRATRIIIKKCEEKGVLIHESGDTGNILAVAPPMIITENEADRLCDSLAEAIEEVGSTKGLKRGLKHKRPR